MTVAKLAPRLEKLPYYGGVDAGGTKFLCAIGKTHSSIDRIISIRTEGQEKTLSAVVDFFREWLSSGNSLSGIGVSAFGPLNRDPDGPDYGALRNSPKPGWRNADIGGYIGRNVEVPLAIDTDVNGAALAEGRWGAAKAQDIRHYAYITVGTGVGIGSVSDGRPINGIGHPELGHYRPPRAPGDRFKGICPFHDDCLEGLICGPAIKERTSQPGEALQDSHPVWQTVAHYLAHLCTVLIYAYAVQRIIIGGGVMNQKILFPLVRSKTSEMLGSYLNYPPYSGSLEDVIVPSGLVIPQRDGLAVNAGVLGGFVLAEYAMERAKANV